MELAIDLKQLQRGDFLTVTIERFNNKYLGETTIQGKTILVPATLPGETVRARVWRNWKRRLLLVPVEIIDPAPERVAPLCQHFGICAGCQFQHLAYEEQLRLKRSRLEGFFAEGHPLSPLPLRAILPSPDPYHYRNSIKLHGPGEPGFWQVQGIDILRNQECPICVPAVEETLQQQRQENFREFGDRGIFNVILRATKAGDTYIGPEQPRPEDIAWLTEELANPLTGQVHHLVVPAHAFWQASTPMIPQLVEEVIRPVRDFAPDLLLESYCGMGLFGLMCAPFVERAVGVEDHPLAVEAARRNREKLGLTNLEILEGKTEDRLEQLLTQSVGEKTSLIVDPPRSGLPKKVLKLILSQPPQQLIYVSCNPESLAQNLSKLCRGTFTLKDMVALDLFPQTKHLECVAVLERIP